MHSLYELMDLFRLNEIKWFESVFALIQIDILNPSREYSKTFRLLSYFFPPSKPKCSNVASMLFNAAQNLYANPIMMKFT